MWGCGCVVHVSSDGDVVAAKAMGNLKEMFGKKERLSEDEADLGRCK